MLLIYPLKRFSNPIVAKAPEKPPTAIAPAPAPAIGKSLDKVAPLESLRAVPLIKNLAVSGNGLNPLIDLAKVITLSYVRFSICGTSSELVALSFLLSSFIPDKFFVSLIMVWNFILSVAFAPDPTPISFKRDTVLNSPLTLNDSIKVRSNTSST